MNTHRIIVLGGGYVGLVVAGQLARRVRRDEASVTLVTASDVRDERMRWHELAAGRAYPLLPVAEALDGSGAAVRIATATGIDLERRTVSLADGEPLAYDWLVVALGSVIDFGAVPGVRENAYGLTDPATVTAAARRIDGLAPGGRVVVIGGGLTGIELATEVAESHPRLRVTIASSRPAGDWLSDGARRHLAEVFARLGIDQAVGRVTGVMPDHVALDVPSSAGTTSTALPADVVLWAGGFRANPLVAASGLAVDELGRARVDATFRSVSHPDVWVVGDAARVPGRDGEPLKMGCRTGAFMALAVPGDIVATLAGRATKPYSGRYFAECISLGRHDALLQWLTPEGEATDRIVTGRAAVRIKELIQRGTQLAARHPGPYGPARRPHLPATVDGAREMIGV